MNKKPKKRKLTLNQDNFCVLYLQYEGNATKAYGEAYKSSSRCNRKTLNEKASRLLNQDKIQDRIQQLRIPIFKKLEVSQTKTLTRLMQGQEFDIRKMYDEDGKLKKVHEMDDDTARAIVGVRHDSEGNVIEYKVIDVKGCSELIGKHLKMFTDRVEHGGQPDNPILVQDTSKLTPQQLTEALRGLTGA